MVTCFFGTQCSICVYSIIRRHCMIASTVTGRRAVSADGVNASSSLWTWITCKSTSDGDGRDGQRRIRHHRRRLMTHLVAAGRHPRAHRSSSRRSVRLRVVGGHEIRQRRRPCVDAEHLHVVDQVVVALRRVRIHLYCLFRSELQQLVAWRHSCVVQWRRRGVAQWRQKMNWSRGWRRQWSSFVDLKRRQVSIGRFTAYLSTWHISRTTVQSQCVFQHSVYIGCQICRKLSPNLSTKLECHLSLEYVKQRYLMAVWFHTH